MTATAVPTWFANATAEITGWPQAEAYDKALTTAGVDHKFEVVQGSQHADQYRVQGVERHDAVAGGQGRVPPNRRR